MNWEARNLVNSVVFKTQILHVPNNFLVVVGQERIPGKCKRHFHPSVQTVSWFKSDFYSMCKMGYFPGDKAAEVWG